MLYEMSGPRLPGMNESAPCMFFLKIFLYADVLTDNDSPTLKRAAAQASLSITNTSGLRTIWKYEKNSITSKVGDGLYS